LKKKSFAATAFVVLIGKNLKHNVPYYKVVNRGRTQDVENATLKIC